MKSTTELYPTTTEEYDMALQLREMVLRIDQSVPSSTGWPEVHCIDPHGNQVTLDYLLIRHPRNEVMEWNDADGTIKVITARDVPTLRRLRQRTPWWHR